MNELVPLTADALPSSQRLHPLPQGRAQLKRDTQMTTISKFQRFLLVDDVAENRFLISKALLKHFPDAVILQCQDSSTAMAMIRKEQSSMAIVHRSRDIDGTTFVNLVRRCDSSMPIVLLSEDRPVPDPVKCGASAVVSWDAWSTIGFVCADIIADTEQRHPKASTEANLA